MTYMQSDCEASSRTQWKSSPSDARAEEKGAHRVSSASPLSPWVFVFSCFGRCDAQACASVQNLTNIECLMALLGSHQMPHHVSRCRIWFPWLLDTKRTCLRVWSFSSAVSGLEVWARRAALRGKGGVCWIGQITFAARYSKDKMKRSETMPHEV